MASGWLQDGFRIASHPPVKKGVRWRIYEFAVKFEIVSTLKTKVWWPGLAGLPPYITVGR